MEVYLVYIEQDSCDYGCENDVSESRVFCNIETARAFYVENHQPWPTDPTKWDQPDCMQLFRCEFVDGMMMPVKLLDQCGNMIHSPHFGIRLETK